LISQLTATKINSSEMNLLNRKITAQTISFYMSTSFMIYSLNFNPLRHYFKRNERNAEFQ